MSPKEEAEILGLTIHTDLNNQQIQSIFSHLERTVNHREIGFIRNRQGRYAELQPASETQIKECLMRYHQLLLKMRELKFVPSARRDELGILAQEAMISAISVFNNPSIKFKSEIFIVNICIAWTYLLHAHYLDLGEDIRYKNKKGEIVKTRHGQEKLIDLGGCLSHSKCPLDSGTKNNLLFLIEIRHEIEHRGSDQIDQSLASKFQANSLNFNRYISSLLGKEYEIATKLPFSLQMSEFVFDKDLKSRKEVTLPKELVVVQEAFESHLTYDEYNDPHYAYRIHILPRTANRKGGADEILKIARSDEDISKVATVILKDAEKAKYFQREVLDYVHSRGYPKFNKHHFQQFWKSIEAKKKGKGYGVWIKSQWFWYDTIFEPVLKHCEMNQRFYT
ncbi:MAG: hypothetical protein DHS20C07_22470 [Methyloligella sp.]|nr:MAG: hypothetical protein DHS20C07_22470 [Methyloligella sp.]